jgi:hypothetical protein
MRGFGRPAGGAAAAGHRKHLVRREMNHIVVGVANGSCFFGACTYFVQCFSRWP